MPNVSSALKYIKQPTTSKYTFICKCRGPLYMSVLNGLWYNNKTMQFCISELFYPGDDVLDKAQQVTYLEFISGGVLYDGEQWTFVW